MKPDETVSTAVAAKILGIHRSTLIRWRQTGQGPSYWLAPSGRPQYDVRSLREWWAARKLEHDYPMAKTHVTPGAPSLFSPLNGLALDRAQKEELLRELCVELGYELPEKKGERAQRVAGVKAAMAAFETWWKAYPVRRRTLKGKCENRWIALHRAGKLPPLEALLEKLERQKRSRDWTKDGGDFIPGPYPYLNGRRWEDELPDDPRSPQQRRVWQPPEERGRA